MGNLGIKIAKVACLSSPDPSSYSLSDILLPPSQSLDGSPLSLWQTWQGCFRKYWFVFFINEKSKKPDVTLRIVNWPFTHNKLLRRQTHKTLGYPLIHYLWSIPTTRPSCHSKCTHLNQVNVRLGHWIGNLWDFSVILSVIPTTIDFPLTLWEV